LGREADIGVALAQLTERLIRRFEQQVPREVVEDTVTGCAARWREARIVDFVPVFTERSCVARLRVLAEEAAVHDVSTVPSISGN
jgi:hypothetical protein